MENSSMEHSPVKIAGEVLRSLREAAGLTQAELAEQAYCSQSLISGLERGTKTTSKKTIGLMDDAVGAKGLIVKIWPVTESGWQSPETLADIEAKATVINDWDDRLVPGLLQTPDYAGAVMRAGLPRATDEEIATAVKTRMDRQSVFTKANPPLGWFVLGQSVLYRPFGGREVMRDQLIRIEEAASQPHFTIQVMRFSSVQHPGSKGPLRVMEFTDNSPTWYTEGSASGRMTDTKDEVASAMADFNLIRACALSPGDSVKLVRKVRNARYE
jgi:transcriptional regulator with XRE-family HTH domain